MTSDWLQNARTSYDTVAESYATLLRDLLADAPYERAALAAFAERASSRGPVADVGCGTGRITAHLTSLGVDAFGLDLSPGMIDQARRDHPALRFAVASMTDLPLRDDTLGGLLAWYSLIHVPDEALSGVLAHFHRTLRPGGPLLLAFHAGDQTRLKTEGYGGHPMNVHVHHRTASSVAERLSEAGFAVEATTVLSSPESTHGAILHARRAG
ncbi:class I SAM-dependent methyltransferase [Actinoplanes sp. NPDC051470]|uniref:class I SAM-dependent methyltransferase n=1 Tax=unclassified Actinoplanes TaxID=2626549 RepID=UPI00343E2B5C